MNIANSSNSLKKSPSKDLTLTINHYLMSEIFDYFNLEELFNMMQINKLSRDCVLKMKQVKHLVKMIVDPKITSHFLLSNNASMLITQNQTTNMKEIKSQLPVFNDFLLFNLLCADIKSTTNNERILKLPNNLGEKGVEFVSRIIRSLNIDVLDCTMTKIGNNGLEVLLSELKTHRQLKHLILSDCYLSKEGMKCIYQSLSSSIIHLDLSNNHFELESFDDLGLLFERHQCRIEGLNLSNNKLQADGLNKITPSLMKYKRLKVLNLKGNDIGDYSCQYLSEILYANRQLIALDVSKNKLSINGLSVLSKQLSNHSSLVEINLQSNFFNADCCTELSQIISENTTIKSLNLSNNKLSEKGSLILSDSLRANNSITHLYIQGNSIGDLGLKYILNALSQSDILETLDVSNNALTEDALDFFGEFIQANTSLISLNASNNELLSLDSIDSALEDNSKLEQLDLGNNGLDDEEVIALCSSLEKRKTVISLNVSCNELTNAVLPSVISLIKNNLVVKLFLNGNGLNKNGLKALGEAIADSFVIRAFDISMNSIGDEGITDLVDQIFVNQRMQRLQYVNVGKNEFNKVTLKKLEALNESLKNLMFLYK